MFSYTTQGTCARTINFDIDERGVITSVEFQGGCNGNLEGISRLVAGRPATEVVQALKGITCGNKPTSCPDQFSKALEEALAQL